MSVRSITRRGRRRSEKMRQIETCRVDRVLSVDSDDSGRPVVTLADPPIYVGPLRVHSFRPFESEREVVGSTSTSQRYDLHIPAVDRMAHLLAAGDVTHWNGPVRQGDFMTRTTPGKIQEVYRIATEHDATDKTAQRLVGDLQTGGITA